MQSYKPNSAKHNFFRAIAVIITLCYILGPSQLLIKSLLHTISHNLKIPSYVLQHNEVDNNGYIKDLSLGIHKSNQKLDHKHEVLDLLDIVFNEQSNEQDNHRGESTQLDIKIKKHITSKTYNLVFQNNHLLDQPIFWETNVYPKVGYLDQLYRPPKA